MIGKIIEVTVDRPLGSVHPRYKELRYPVNYGYVKGIIGGDGEEQDVYILGVDCPVSSFVGRVVAVIHRLNDTEDKWVVAPEGISFAKDDIARLVEFQEKYFDIEIITEI